MNHDELSNQPAKDPLSEGVAQIPAPDRVPPGQLGTFALLGAAGGSVPLPWLPDAIARRVRGALVQDIAARNGLALSPGARSVLADPSLGRHKRSPVAAAFGYIGKKVLVRFGPLAVLPPLRAALETYVLGYLFHRYLTRAKRESGGRVELAEARLVRDAIERAVMRVATPEGGLQWPVTPTTDDDARDEMTQALDGILSAASTIPSWLLHRLDVAFDDVLRLR